MRRLALLLLFPLALSCSSPSTGPGNEGTKTENSVRDAGTVTDQANPVDNILPDKDTNARDPRRDPFPHPAGSCDQTKGDTDCGLNGVCRDGRCRLREVTAGAKCGDVEKFNTVCSQRGVGELCCDKLTKPGCKEEWTGRCITNTINPWRCFDDGDCRSGYQCTKGPCQGIACGPGNKVTRCTKK